MKSMLMKFFIVILTCISVAACSTNTQKQNETVGTVSGAVVGGLAGSAIGGGAGKVVAIGAGAVIGALVGNRIGKSMESSDTQKTYHALNNNQTNKSSYWKNKHTGARYTVTPTSDPMQSGSQSYCRQFKTKAIINGKSQVVTGTACRQSDGTWKTI
ncbi:MAG: glycine zipper 2TM domain-containing protein [Gammaproteobacteria bacterium]|nr:MAG: glycine zipper 2TM domain-containing protein [Gammaproteobacteria bacterium]